MLTVATLESLILLYQKLWLKNFMLDYFNRPNIFTKNDYNSSKHGQIRK